MARAPLRPLGRPLESVASAADLAQQRAAMARLDAALADKRAVVRAGWGEEYASRVREKGKWTTWERISALVDPGSQVFEVGTLVNWDRRFQGSKRLAPGAGVVTAFGRVHDRWVVIIANDNTVASGAWWPLTPEKIQRAQQMARALRLPVVYLVDCSGLFLPEQAHSFSGRTGAGHIFTMNARLAADGVPQIAAVFGDCIAGGGYMPIISDRVVMTEGAYMVIAGAALIRGAKALKLTSLDIGGPEVHVHASGCADVRVPDDPTAIRLVREEVSRLPSSAVDFYRHGVRAAPPRFEPDELSALFPTDFRQTYEIEDVIARLVDDSLFHEVMPHTGPEMITGVARISGLWVGVVANRQGLVGSPTGGRRAGGALYREGIAKISTFARTCGDDGLPLIWLQDISGFDIGVEAERLGLLGYGSSLIYGNSTSISPVFTVLLRKASGAGYYAMAGHPYEPVVQLATPITRLAVMEGRTLAIATYNSRLDDDFEIATRDPAERAEIEAGMRSTAARIEADMDPVGAAARMDADEVVPVGELRAWLTCLVEAAWQSIGYRRTRNPRIWGLHDLDAVTGPPAGSGWAGGLGRATEPRPAVRAGEELRSPTVGQWLPRLSRGAVLSEGEVIGVIAQGGSHAPIAAPGGAAGAVATIRPAGVVAYGDPLLELGEPEGGVAATRGASATDGSLPPGVVAVRTETDGTFFGRPAPAEPAFAAPGARVEAHATVGLIEVMKTFNPLRAPVAGVVERVLVEDGGGVQAGQVVVWIRP